LTQTIAFNKAKLVWSVTEDNPKAGADPNLIKQSQDGTCLNANWILKSNEQA
jgi:hypothetical protein